MHNLLSKRVEALSHHETLSNPSSCLQLSLPASTNIVQLFSHVWSWWWACEWGWRFCRWRFVTVVLKELVWACTGLTAFFVYLTSWSMFFFKSNRAQLWPINDEECIPKSYSILLRIVQTCWWVPAKACLILLKIAPVLLTKIAQK